MFSSHVNVTEFKIRQLSVSLSTAGTNCYYDLSFEINASVLQCTEGVCGQGSQL